MKSAPSKKSWKLPVTKAGIIKLPLQLREAVFLWEGDTVQATAFADADGYGVVLRVQPHGLTREQIQRAEQRMLRALRRDKKAGRLVRFQKQVSRRDGRFIAEALASGPARPLRKRDFDRAVTRGIRRAKARKSAK